MIIRGTGGPRGQPRDLPSRRRPATAARGPRGRAQAGRRGTGRHAKAPGAAGAYRARWLRSPGRAGGLRGRAGGRKDGRVSRPVTGARAGKP